MTSFYRLKAVWLLLFVAASSACPSPGQAFEDFNRRVVDAPVPPDAPELPDAAPLESLPDVTGRFLLGMSPSFAPTYQIQMLQLNVLTVGEDGTGTLDVRLTPLSTAERLPVGTETVVEDVPVSSAGQFEIVLDDMVIPAEADPITGAGATGSFVLRGSIRSTDRMCGDVTGALTSPMPVDMAGSTWSSIRVDEEAIGSALPPPEVACPAEEDVDAGVPDALPVDASFADAASPDAPSPDAPSPDAP